MSRRPTAGEAALKVTVVVAFTVAMMTAYLRTGDDSYFGWLLLALLSVVWL
jgi:hypothetical protein